MRRSARILAGCVLCGLVPTAAGAALQETRLGAPERELLATDLRRGRAREVLPDLDELVLEFPQDFALRSLRALARDDLGDHAGALEDARAGQALAEEASDAPREERAQSARTLADLLVELGQARESLGVLGRSEDFVRPAEEPRDAWTFGRALLEIGERERARVLFRQGAETPSDAGWASLLAQARCQRALGRIVQAAQTLAQADLAARRAGGLEPDVSVEWGEVKFEGYGEVEGTTPDQESPASRFREALRVDPSHEGARLGLFELGRVNWNRDRDPPRELLRKMLEVRPRSIRAQLARASLAIDDGDLRTAREALQELVGLAPGRRDVRTERAALAWIEHDRDGARALLDELARDDPADSAPEREVARHLLELYRFAEGLPFAQAAVERDPRDARAWKELGRAQANTGDEENGRTSLKRSEALAEGRQDAWRRNTLMVLERMGKELVPEDAGSLRFLWPPDGADVLATYYVPFYRAAREDVARRYGYTPDRVQIEVFQRWADFSVRSTGFEGFPALGVCFGPVVTAVSPLSELRGQFSWARTAFHEFTHVVHLGLSHNRCPRWVTEGLATWEEVAHRPAWTRNARRELLDARANGEILPIRELNGAFRGSRILFAYYQSGLVCEMLVERNGFGPLVRLLEAFDRGADLDGALAEVFGATPEELDQDFLAFVDRRLAGLAIEPRWSPELCTILPIRLGRTPPAGAAERRAWGEDWCRVAWGRYWSWQRGERQGGDVPVEIEEALRLASTAGELPARGLFLRAELGLARGDRAGALADLRAGFAAGGEDYRARMALARLLSPAPEGALLAPGQAPGARVEAGAQGSDPAAAEEAYRAAERAFPGYDDAHFSAELGLARLLAGQGREDEANEAKLRWLAYNSDNYEIRVEVAAWLDQKQRFAESARVWEEANEVDPFRRHLHLAWGRALEALGRHEEAVREFGVAPRVSPELDGDLRIAQGIAQAAGLESLDALVAVPEEAVRARPERELLLHAREVGRRFPGEEPLALGEQALVLEALGRLEEARAALERALALDPACEPALRARERLSAREPAR